LRDCPKCEQAYEVETAMAHAISRAAPYYKAPPELRERIQVSLREAIGVTISRGAAAEDPLPVRRPEEVRRGVFFDRPWNWLALAAAIVLAAIIASSLLPKLWQPGADQFLATQLIANHVRSLMADHLTDVASSDQHTVKPWLDVKLDFAAPVVDLSGDGLADALITSITTRQQLWFIKGASILLTCLSGRRHPWMAKGKRLWNARAITWSTGLTATSLTGRYPTSVLATCRISSSFLKNKSCIVDGGQRLVVA